MNLFIGDSLGLPSMGYGVRYEDTVPHCLADGDGVWMLAHTGATVTELKDVVLEMSRLLPYHFYDMAVIYVGLADCAPRPIAHEWRHQISTMRNTRLRRFIIKFLHKFRPFIQKYIGFYQRTSKKSFSESLRRLYFLTAMISKKVVCIMIPPVRESMERQSPRISEQITEYNGCVARLAPMVKAAVIDARAELGSDPLRYLTDDGHLTVDGNAIVINKLKEILK